MSSCRDCHKTWTSPKACHCVSCHQTFSSETSFRLHQGAIAGCYDPPFENNSGTGYLLVQRPDGVWAKPAAANPFWAKPDTAPAKADG